jgi:integrase
MTLHKIDLGTQVTKLLPCSCCNPRKWFGLALEEPKIKNFRWHDLRHRFTSRLVMKKVNLGTVRELAGHKTISMTTKYAHLTPEHDQAAVEKLDPAAS